MLSALLDDTVVAVAALWPALDASPLADAGVEAGDWLDWLDWLDGFDWVDEVAAVELWLGNLALFGTGNLVAVEAVAALWVGHDAHAARETGLVAGWLERGSLWEGGGEAGEEGESGEDGGELHSEGWSEGCQSAAGNLRGFMLPEEGLFGLRFDVVDCVEDGGLHGWDSGSLSKLLDEPSKSQRCM